MPLTSVTQADGSALLLESNDAVVVHGVDAAGLYLGLQPLNQVAGAVPHAPPPGDGWRWAGRWVRDVSIAEAREAALQRIDRAAGAQRLRYITDVPGQQAVYLLKLDEAEAYLTAVSSNPQAAVPPHIAAEAASTSSTPTAVAELVVGLAAVWNTVLSPAIEGARMGGKTAVNAAQTPAAVALALAAALDAIGAL
jgi:hypothetical protein